MNVQFSPEAVQELLVAQAWYEACVAGLGLAFAHAVDAVITNLQNNPHIYTVIC